MKSKIKKIIQRKCLVCGKRINIVLYKDGFYKNAHYFKKFKIPFGKGEYKKVKTTKIFGRKTDVIKWTGKEKEIEYWECNACYEEAINECWLEEVIEKLYGKRCPDYEKNCACCQAWSVYDTIIKLKKDR